MTALDATARAIAATIAAAIVLVAIGSTTVASAKPAPNPAVAFVGTWSAPYDAFVRAYSASDMACLPTSHPRCASSQLRASNLVAPVIAALSASPPPAPLKADVGRLEKGLRAIRIRLAASARHPASQAVCRGEVGPCTSVLPDIVDAITDLTDITQLNLPIPD